MVPEIPPELILTSDERNALPEKARQYISALEMQLESYNRTLNTTNEELRKKRFSHWNR